MTFSFFALGGAMRIFKLFVSYYPNLSNEIAFATLFLPSVGYWGAGLMKDPICLAAIGFFVYGLFKIFIQKRGILPSIFWVLLSGYLLTTIKVYILLALIPGIAFWLLGEFNKNVKEHLYRRLFTISSFVIASIVGFILIRYMTSLEAAKSFQLETLLDKSTASREYYERQVEGSGFSIKTQNPALLVLNGIVATFFRPFLWEVRSPIALFSALEALLFVILVANFVLKRGIIAFFKNAFSNPILVFCFIFSLVFAASVGITATNFGTLSRYKIPCLPFFLVMMFIIYFKSAVRIPEWTRMVIIKVTK
ncbi:MAG: hypothetical protein ABR502_10050 [Chitinophagaceae bacterium]